MSVPLDNSANYYFMIVISYVKIVLKRRLKTSHKDQCKLTRCAQEHSNLISNVKKKCMSNFLLKVTYIHAL